MSSMFFLNSNIYLQKKRKYAQPNGAIWTLPVHALMYYNSYDKKFIEKNGIWFTLFFKRWEKIQLRACTTTNPFLSQCLKTYFLNISTYNFPLFVTLPNQELKVLPW